MSLCERCRNFDIQAFSYGGFEYRGYPLKGVIESSEPKLKAGSEEELEPGCSFCSLLLDQLLSSDNSWKWSHLGIAIRRSKDKEKAAVPWMHTEALTLFFQWIAGLIRTPWIHIYVRRGSPIEAHSGFECPPLDIKALGVYIGAVRTKKASDEVTDRAVWFHTAADPGTPAFISRDITGQLLANNYIGTQTDFDAIRRWHTRCRLNHPRCKITLSGSEEFNAEKVLLPSRCIEIESENGQMTKCTLRETGGQEGKYIALSHRWGDDTELVKTLRANYNCRIRKCTKASCQNCQTPKETTLFAHTYEIAMKLGIAFVWIDSLCIIQDDLDDWDRESAKMADYYQHAWLTVAATRTRNEGGLFGEIETRDIARVSRLPYRDRSGRQKGHFYIQCTGGKAISRDYKTAISRSDLLRRGWVYQEWLLSRRVLAFADYGLFVMCQTGNPQSLAGDDVRFIRDEEDDIDDKVDVKDQPDKSFKNSVRANLFSAESITRIWRSVVQEYSRLQLTKLSEDRLVALSGIASEYGRAVQARREQPQRDNRKRVRNDTTIQYLCGLWFPEARDLMWEQSEPGPRLRAKGLPTWSWASMGTKVPNPKGGEDIPSKGLEVRWSDVFQRFSTDCMLEEFIRVPVDPISLRPQFGAVKGYKPMNVYGNDGRFAVLGILGRLMEVRLHGAFQDDDSRTVAGNITGHDDVGRDMWRCVTTTASLDLISGWASLEHPDFQSVIAAEPELCALVVSVVPKVQGGWLLGKNNPHLSAYEVLYLRKIQIPDFEDQGRDCYERVGIGRLFGDEVNVAFEATDKSHIWLA
ncbi:heterokaryon incompatibility protein-domain-containing protein [Xylariaceae sp. FL1019]|nr:heterokaryon incompatibility protein-domain-containing protein [Xylariaceae sp. FL1019]